MSPINDRTSPGLECSFCTPVSRRDFVKTIGAVLLPRQFRSSGNRSRRLGPFRLVRPRSAPPKPLSLVSTRH